MEELSKEKKLLQKMYEVQDEMEDLLDDGMNDVHYALMTALILRLEEYLKERQDLM
jgi:hypothetical protein